MDNKNTKRKTLIASVYSGCGKTYLANSGKTYSCRDSDTSAYKKTEGWEIGYIDDVMADVKSGKYDFIFIGHRDSILNEMERRNIPYIIVQPDNLICWDAAHEPPERKRERQLIKQQWFGRLILRDNFHIKDFGSWLENVNYPSPKGNGLVKAHG